MALDIFLQGLGRLRRGSTPYGKAPHKPIFLLTILDLIDSGHFSDNRFYVDAILVSAFHENWDLFAPEGFQEDFTQPFYYMQNDKAGGHEFWFLIPKAVFSIISHIKNINTLAEIVDHAALSDSFFHVLANKVNREAIRAMLLNTYFPNAKNLNYVEKQNKVSYLESIDQYILNEVPKVRRLRVAEEEMVYIRNWSFKNWIPKIYQNTCSISGMSINSTKGHSLIDACHIVPFSHDQDDRVTNGIALCPNLHRAFDNGLVSIDQDYRVLVSDQVVEESGHPYGLSVLKGRKIILPEETHRWPNPENLEWHRKIKFLK